MAEKDTDLQQHQLEFHRVQSSKENGYLLNGHHGFKSMMDQAFDHLWPGEVTSAHVTSFIQGRLKERAQVSGSPHFFAVDVGAGHNAFLRELADVDPAISCRAIALGDPRTEKEKSEDQEKKIEYSTEAVETILDELHDVDFIYCHGTLQHIVQPLQLLKSLYDAGSLGAELYIEWNGKGQTSQVEWENGSYDDFLDELKARGIDIQTKHFVLTRLLRIKVNEQKFPDDFFAVSEPVESKYKPLVGTESPAVKSVVTLAREKMKAV